MPKPTTAAAAAVEEPPVTIGTHNGCFHCDEVTACFLLRQLPKYKDAVIKRSRNPAVLNECDIVVDVGGVYDSGLGRFDHHQREFNETFNSICPDKPWKIKLSSAGLIYCHFGLQVIAQMTKRTLDDPFVVKAFDLMYENFIQEIDAIDNGVKQFPSPPAPSTDEEAVGDGDQQKQQQQRPLYSIHTGLSARVGHLNPWWNDANPTPEDELFQRAMALVGAEFSDRLRYYSECWWPARQLVEAAFVARAKHDSPRGRLLVLDACQAGLPWKSHLYELERQADCLGCVLFALYRDGNGTWRVQAVPPDEQRGFENRLPLPAAWRGLRDAELSQLSGIEGCVFVHASGFIGGNASFDGALKMARMTMEMAEKKEVEAANGKKAD